MTRKDEKRRFLLAGLMLGMFFSSMDQTVVGTAMPRIIGDLGGLDILTWVSIAYMLSSTSIVPVAGKLADILGRRNIYITGIAIFMIGSALCGLSQNMGQLILFRGIQGIGAGIMMPLAMTIVGDYFPPEKRGKWMGIMGALYGLSAIVGPIMGGYIVDHAVWRWVFYINLPFGALAIAGIYLGLYGEKPIKKDVKIDYAGAFSLIISVVSLMLALTVGGKEFAWTSWQVFILLTIFALAAVTFVYIESATKEPILSLSFFKNKSFTIINIVGFLAGMGMFGTMMFLPLYLQGVQSFSATSSGSIMIPMILSIIVASIAGGRLIRKFQFRVFFIAGMLLMSLGLFLLGTIDQSTTKTVTVLIIVCIGMGIGVMMPSTTVAIQNAFPAEQRGVATSSTQFFRSIGATIGMAAFGAIMNLKSISILQNSLFPKIQGVKELAQGVLGHSIEKAHSNPQSLFNILLKPELLNSLNDSTRRLLLVPLKYALADSLHLVFFIAGFTALAGVAIGYFLGDERIRPNNSSETDSDDLKEEKLQNAGLSGEPA